MIATIVQYCNRNRDAQRRFHVGPSAAVSGGSSSTVDGTFIGESTGYPSSTSLIVGLTVYYIMGAVLVPSEFNRHVQFRVPLVHVLLSRVGLNPVVNRSREGESDVGCIPYKNRDDILLYQCTLYELLATPVQVSFALQGRLLIYCVEECSES